jgi:hypothetical protein
VSDSGTVFTENQTPHVKVYHKLYHVKVYHLNPNMLLRAYPTVLKTLALLKPYWLLKRESKELSCSKR